MYSFTDSLPLRTQLVRFTLCIFFLCLAVACALRAQTLALFDAVPPGEQTASLQLKSASNLAGRTFSHFTLLNLKPGAFRQLHTFKNKNVSIALPVAGKTVRVALEPYNAFTSTATIIAKTPSGDVPITLDNDFALFRGTLEGEKSSMVNVSVNARSLQMVIRTGSETLTIEQMGSETQDQTEPQSGEEFPYVLYSSADNKQQREFSCGTEEHSDHDTGPHSDHQPFNPKNGSELQSAVRLEAEMGIDIDFATYQALGSNQAQAAQYAAAVIAAVSQIFERDINTRLLVSHVQVWTTADPYVSASSAGAALTRLGQTWNANYSSVNRDLVHLLTVRGLGGGVAWLDVLCNRNNGYGVSSGLRARFPIDPGWTTIVVAHEIGHNFGSRHTHSCWWQGGAIDRCAPAERASGQPACFTGTVASRGTIMSYCHTQPGGTANIDMNFHPLCATYMRTRAEAATCLNAASTGGGTGGGVIGGGGTGGGGTGGGGTGGGGTGGGGNGGGVTLTASVSYFAPMSGGRGTSVMISGANFVNVSAVRFGGIEAQSFTVNSPTQVTAVIGAGATGQVQVVTATNTASSAQSFTFTSGVSPSQSVVSFSAIRIGNTNTMTIMFRNNGTTPVSFLSSSISGANASDFTIIGNTLSANGSLGAGQTQTLTLRYRPSGTQTRSATLNLSFTGESGTVSVELVGAVDVSPLLMLSVNSLSIPPTRVGETSIPVKYELQGWYMNTSVILVASGDVQLAVSSTGSWQSRMELPVDSSYIRRTVWVRFMPKREGVQSNTIGHWSESTTVSLPVTSFTQTAYFSLPRELNLGNVPFGTSTIGTYFFHATNLHAPVVVTAATGVMLSTGFSGPWQSTLTFSPLETIVSAAIFVRYEASTHGTLVSRIMHSTGMTNASLMVRANTATPLFIFREPQIAHGMMNFGYVPQRFSSTATYWLEAINATAPISLRATEGFTLALADNDSWSDTLTLTPAVTVKNLGLRQLIFVRFQPRWEGIFAGAVTHRMNGTASTLRLLGSSLTPMLAASSSRLDFGTVSGTQSSPVRSYQIQASGITNAIQIRIPPGVEASLSQHGPWLQCQMTLMPVSAQAHASIFVRTTEAVVGQEYRTEIIHSASENGVAIHSSINVTANLPQNSPIASDSPTTIAEQASKTAPMQSYPNPFTDETTITWMQPESASVRVVVSASNGAIVRSLTLSGLSAGAQRAVWDGRDESGQALASGVYFAHVYVEGRSIGKRVMIMLAR